MEQICAPHEPQAPQQYLEYLLTQPLRVTRNRHVRMDVFWVVKGCPAQNRPISGGIPLGATFAGITRSPRTTPNGSTIIAICEADIRNRISVCKSACGLHPYSLPQAKVCSTIQCILRKRKNLFMRSLTNMVVTVTHLTRHSIGST